MLNRFKALVPLVLAVIIAGCAAPPKKKEEVVFFPPAPALPIIQYLVSYNGSKDMEEESAFQKFIVGEKEPRWLDKPYGVAIYDGMIYVCDTNHTVTVFDFKKKEYGFLKGARGKGKLIQPLNIMIEADGTKYVSDNIRGQVVAFDRNGEYLRTYGTPGTWKPVSAWAFEDRLYVVDREKNAVIVLDKKSGEILTTIGDKGKPQERTSLPTNLTFDRNGDLYVSDAAKFQILKYDRDGHFLTAIGEAGDSLGHFARPKGIAVDREDHLFVVDAAFNNVQIFNKAGRLLLFFGEAGDEPGNFILPAQVVVDYDNLKYFSSYVQPDFEPESLVIVTNQIGDHRVSVFAFGKEKGVKYPTDDELLKKIQELRQKELDKLKVTEVPAEKKGPEDEHKTGEGNEP